MSPLSWAGRARRPASGPEQALEYADALYNLAWYLTRHSGDAEDLVQETYARAIPAWDRLAPDSNVKAWLFRILRNLHLDRWRRLAHGPSDLREGEEEAAADPSDRADELEPGPLRELLAEEVAAAVQGLSEPFRTAVLLDMEGLTEAEMAQIMECAPGTVKSRLARARLQLRRLLRAYRP